jgi:hypothetical protein
MAKTIEKPQVKINPILKTVEEMSIVSGLGENKLRIMMDQGEIDYIQNGNRRLLTEGAIWDWYERKKVKAIDRSQQSMLKVKRDVMER